MRQLRRLLRIAFCQLALCCHISRPTTPVPSWNFPFRLILYALNALSGDMCYTKDSATEKGPKNGMPSGRTGMNESGMRMGMGMGMGMGMMMEMGMSRS